MGAQAFQAVVKGVVQGVAFRYHTRDMATSLGITGWVRNLPNGDVAIVAEGEKAALDELAGWLEHGPSLARVTNLQLDWCPSSAKYVYFDIVY
jgi:acylphosphatase